MAKLNLFVAAALIVAFVTVLAEPVMAGEPVMRIQPTENRVVVDGWVLEGMVDELCQERLRILQSLLPSELSEQEIAETRLLAEQGDRRYVRVCHETRITRLFERS